VNCGIERVECPTVKMGGSEDTKFVTFPLAFEFDARD
jgi:hypothetical protein